MRITLSRLSEIMDKSSLHECFPYGSFISTAKAYLVPLAAVAALAISVSFAGAQSAGNSSKTDQVSPGNAQNGRKLFAADGCFECHGREAQGGGLNGPRLVPDPYPLEALLVFVRHPTGEMPPYTKKVLSDKDLADIYAFLSSQPHPPSVDSIPILKH
jgi:mono/diheme cytochrome c family protein